MRNKLLAVACLALTLVACATPAPQRTAVAARHTTPAGCVSDTGTRVPLSRNDCAGVGRSWSQDQLKQTGHVDLSQALQSLDVSVYAH